MAKANVRLTYRQVIDHTSTRSFERMVFDQSFREFTIRCQEYNPGSQYSSLAQMIANNPKAVSLHYKTAFAIREAVKSLNNVIPDISDLKGIPGVTFTKYDFTILASNPFNQAEHVIAIDYTTRSLFLLGVMDNYMLLTYLAKEDILSKEYQTFMIKKQPGLSMCTF